MTLREKAAQMVWPTVLGDYTSLDSPQWQRVRREIVEEKVGGYTISVGPPMEIAAKLNAMQQLSEVRRGRFEVMGFAGNTGPDHIDQFHGMPEFLRRLEAQ